MKWIMLIVVLVAGCAAQVEENTPNVVDSSFVKPSVENQKHSFNESVSLNRKPEISPKSKEPYVIIRDYTYQASAFDSKVVARKNAIDQLTTIVNEEIGIYIEHYLDINETGMDGNLRREVSSKIQTFSNGINKIEPLEESWNGSQYYIKAKVSVDPEKNLALMLEAIKSKSTQKDIDRLNKVLSEQKIELESTQSKNIELRKKLVVNEIVNETRREELLKSKEQLTEASNRAISLSLEQDKADRELAEIKQKINKAILDKKAVERKACLVEKGMKRSVVHQIIGSPQALQYDIVGFYMNADYYGEVTISYRHDIVTSILGCK
ncbi:hypothetical protein C0J08_14890 [Marinomonas sp. CT5]|uniref:hypothetical protein n=1 Tax=Marinomonas sp. CT5 TaxID=2066133 RepID=UPI001BAE597E|nr:hypothetical protein [Marinomonas sp. CT5]QUX96605.1 hypothetical protein C0J08_14890 [Marinomonas sp. CT5]